MSSSFPAAAGKSAASLVLVPMRVICAVSCRISYEIASKHKGLKQEHLQRLWTGSAEAATSRLGWEGAGFQLGGRQGALTRVLVTPTTSAILLVGSE